MALKIYATFEGEESGEIEGGATRKDYEGKHEVVQLNSEVTSPLDTDSGFPTGKRSHKPLRVMMAINKATPLLFKAMVTNENFTKVEFQWWRPSKTGTEEQFYTTELTNARITHIRQWLPNCVDTSNSSWSPMFEVSLAFEKVAHTYVDGGVTGEDDWNVSAA